MSLINYIKVYNQSTRYLYSSTFQSTCTCTQVLLKIQYLYLYLYSSFFQVLVLVLEYFCPVLAPSLTHRRWGTLPKHLPQCVYNQHQILVRELDRHRCKVKEAIQIRQRRPTKNRDQGYQLPPVYDKIIPPVSEPFHRQDMYQYVIKPVCNKIPHKRACNVCFWITWLCSVLCLSSEGH